jgi:hypothetical protein
MTRGKAVTIRMAGAGMAGGLACLVVGVHLAGQAARRGAGGTAQGTAMAVFGAGALTLCLLLIAAILAVSGAGRLRQWRRSGRLTAADDNAQTGAGPGPASRP